MNSVILIGRLVKDPQTNYSQSGMAVTKFTLAVDRPTKGQDKKADFPRVIVFGKQAENCGKYLAKGLRVSVNGRIQTGSYQNKSGQTVYTTDVVANHVEFIDWADSQNSQSAYNQDTQQADYNQDPETQFQAIDEAVPF